MFNHYDIMNLYKLGMFVMLSTLTTVVSCMQKKVSPAIPVDKAIEARVEKVLAKMTLEEKAGQMVQITISKVFTNGRIDSAKLSEVIGKYKVGSLLNAVNDAAAPHDEIAGVIAEIQRVSMREIGIPCIYGLDEIHGATYISDGTMFPQEINIGASFNREYASKLGNVIGYETRAAMVPWVFAPVMDLGRDPRWPRMWESWGEDPFLQSEISVAATKGIQGEDPNHVDKFHTSVSIKHYMAYGVPLSGKDRTPAYVPVYDLRERYFRPFKECLQAGALNMMVNSAAINGIPTHANHELLTVWAKEQLAWDGMIVTDWADIDNLYKRDHVAADEKEALAMGINAGIDMVMEPHDAKAAVLIREAAEEGLIPMSRIDDAVRRILRMKFRLGLFDEPVWDVSGYDKIGGPQFRAQAYASAVESMVLLKNEDGLLPLKEGTRILVTGPNANSMRCLNGGWSYDWQGKRADEFAGADNNTILEALQLRFGKNNVAYVPGVEYDADKWNIDHACGIGEAVAAAAKADVVIACIGENSYCETPGNINDLNLSRNQKSLVEALAKVGKPIVFILNQGRPRIIGDIEPLSRAVVNIMLPGNSGGDALAALLAGDENFSGKQPFTYSKYVNSLHTYDYKVSEHVETMNGLYNYDAIMDVQWPFGYGLSYTNYVYEDFKVISPVASAKDAVDFRAEDLLRFEVTVRNEGKVAGKEAVLLFSSDIVASMIPDVKRLRQFAKVELGPGESKSVILEIPAHELAFVGHDGKWRLEKGLFRMSCGGQSLMINCAETKVWDTPNID